MLIYNSKELNKYNYDPLNRLDLKRQLSVLYTYIRVAGDKDILDLFPIEWFQASVHYLPSVWVLGLKKVIAIEVTRVMISRSLHRRTLFKTSLSYHLSYRNMRLTTNDCHDIMKHGYFLSSFLYIKYIPLKLGISLVRYKQILLKDDE